MDHRLTEVAKWAKTAADARQRRDEAIRAALADGATQRAVAEAAGLTHPGVARIGRA